MSYKVIKFFTDLKDDNHPYNVGDTYPRNGVKVLASRYKELASDKNKQGTPLIVEIIEEKPTKKSAKSKE